MLSTSAGADVLTPAQRLHLDRNIRTQIKTDSGFQSLRAEWTEAHQVAEFLCRPVALKTLRKKIPVVDKVFLGDGKNGGLILHSPSRLIGIGQYRAGGINWVSFSFKCELSPSTGEVTGFDYSQNARTRDARIMTPGPVIHMDSHTVRLPL
ncbi:hypothetical protein RBC57_004601 [Salmonella enterica]|uniref:DUF930 domain-containing protein n=1 Tax=Salmonella enterica TaxID=28901 RepID=A0A628V8M9_SALER|nr:hypothetical protein [Salmonella enterica]EEC6702096.1 DUF930 domain-containing protein [Salmonella enterica]ELF5202354.1 hypothetical protein [Salmonella enterica]